MERGACCLHVVQLMPLRDKTPPSLLPQLSPDWFYLSGTGLPKYRCVDHQSQRVAMSWVQDIQGGQKTRSHRHIILSNFNRFEKITGRFVGKFAVKCILKIPPHLAYVATLPCEH